MTGDEGGRNSWTKTATQKVSVAFEKMLFKGRVDISSRARLFYLTIGNYLYILVFMQSQNLQPDLSKFQYVLAQCTCANLRKTSRVITQLYDEFLQPSGLLATQFLLLGAVGLRGGIAITPLAELLAMDPTTLARNLKPLERDGLVEIAKGKDRRTRIVKLTDRGQEALVQAFPLWEQAQTHVIEKIGADRQRAMLGDWADLVSKVNK